MSQIIFKAQGQIGKVETLADGGNKVTVYTQELPWERMTELFSLRNKAIHFLMSEGEIDEKEVPTEEIKLETQYKTPSQRLRGVIWRLWEQGNQKQPFDTVFYPQAMEKIINQLKERLN